MDADTHQESESFGQAAVHQHSRRQPTSESQLSSEPHGQRLRSGTTLTPDHRHTSFTSSDSTQQFTPRTDDASNYGVNRDDSFDHNDFSMSNGDIAFCGHNNDYEGKPHFAQTTHFGTTRLRARASTGLHQAQYDGAFDDRLPAMIAPTSAASLAACDTRTNIDGQLHAAAVPNPDKRQNLDVYCDGCGEEIKHQYYNCPSCSSDDTFDLCVACNAMHPCCTILTDVSAKLGWNVSSLEDDIGGEMAREGIKKWGATYAEERGGERFGSVAHPSEIDQHAKCDDYSGWGSPRIHDSKNGWNKNGGSSDHGGGRTNEGGGWGSPAPNQSTHHNSTPPSDKMEDQIPQPQQSHKSVTPCMDARKSDLYHTKVAAAGRPVGAGRPLPGITGFSSELNFLHDYIVADSVSQDDRCKAIGIVGELANSVQSLQHADAPSNRGDSNVISKDFAVLKQLVTDLSAKLTSAEDRLSSLASHVQIEAKARVSMSDLYDKEFFRVGQDMTTTVKRMDGTRSELQAHSANVTNEMQALSAAVAESVAAARVQVDGVEESLEMYKVASDTEKADQAKRGEPIDWKLAALLETLNAHNSTISGLRETFDAEISTLKAAVEERTDSRAGMEPDPSPPGRASGEELRVRMVEQAGQHSAMEARLKSLEEHTNVSVKGQLQELRATTTSFDTEIESANARIGKLEKAVGDGLNDNRLTDLEFQISDLVKRMESLVSNPPADSKRAESVAILKTDYRALRREMEDLKQRRMDVDLSEVNARLDVGSDTDADILRRLDRIDARLKGLGAKTFAKSPEAEINYHRDLQCYNCGEYGHIARECAESKGVKCHNCDGYGHIARECDQPPKSEVQCRNCTYHGHVASQCTEPCHLECSNCKQIGHSYMHCKNPAADVEVAVGGDWGGAGDGDSLDSTFATWGNASGGWWH